jgi:hypothetical protein
VANNVEFIQGIGQCGKRYRIYSRHRPGILKPVRNLEYTGSANLLWVNPPGPTIGSFPRACQCISAVKLIEGYQHAVVITDKCTPDVKHYSRFWKWAACKDNELLVSYDFLILFNGLLFEQSSNET